MVYYIAKSTQIIKYESRKAVEINQNIPKPTLSSGKEYLVISRIKLEQLDVTLVLLSVLCIQQHRIG